MVSSRNVEKHGVKKEYPVSLARCLDLRMDSLLLHDSKETAPLKKGRGRLLLHPLNREEPSLGEGGAGRSSTIRIEKEPPLEGAGRGRPLVMAKKKPPPL